MADEGNVEGNDVAGSRDKRAARDEAIRSDGGDMSATVDPWKDAVERKPVDAVDKAVIGLDSFAIDTDVVDDLSQRFTVVRSEARSANVGHEGIKGAEADVAAWKDAGAAFEGIKDAVAESSGVKAAESGVAGAKGAEADWGGAKAVGAVSGAAGEAASGVAGDKEAESGVAGDKEAEADWGGAKAVGAVSDAGGEAASGVAGDKEAESDWGGAKAVGAVSDAGGEAASGVAGDKEADSDWGGAKDAVSDQGEGINDAEFDLGEKVWDVEIKHVLPDDAFTDKWAPAMVDEFADKFAVVAPNPIEPIDGLVELSDPVDLDYSASSDALWADLGPGVQPLDSSDAGEPDDGDGFADV